MLLPRGAAATASSRVPVSKIRVASPGPDGQPALVLRHTREAWRCERVGIASEGVSVVHASLDMQALGGVDGLEGGPALRDVPARQDLLGECLVLGCQRPGFGRCVSGLLHETIAVRDR